VRKVASQSFLYAATGPYGFIGISDVSSGGVPTTAEHLNGTIAYTPPSRRHWVATDQQDASAPHLGRAAAPSVLLPRQLRRGPPPVSASALHVRLISDSGHAQRARMARSLGGHPWLGPAT
jgi:hypothetical protein